MNFGLFLESNRHTCRSCTVKCVRVEPARRGDTLVEGGWMMNETGKSAIELNDQAKCVERGVGVFGGSVIQPVIEQWATGNLFNLRLGIAVAIGALGEDFASKMDDADWDLIDMFLNKSGAEENVFGYRTAKIKVASFARLKITDIKPYSEE